MAHPDQPGPAHGNAPPDLRRLSRLNRTAVFLGALAVGLAGLFLPGLWGGLLLAVIVIAMGLLMRQTWAVTPPPMRLIRMIILLALALIAYSKF